MNDPDLEIILKKLTDRGFQDVALEYRKTHTEQVRFSRNTEDLYNDWDESTVSIFASRGKKVVSTVLGDLSNLEGRIEQLWEISKKVPENNRFEGINPIQMTGDQPISFNKEHYDLQDMTTNLVNSALESGAERTAGVIYNRNHMVTVKTNYNDCFYETGGIEVLIRSFKGESTGQEARQFGKSMKVDSEMIRNIGKESTEPLNKTNNSSNLKPGRYKVLLSPYVIGNIISYSSDFLSFQSVESGLSCFVDKIGEDVSMESFNLVDDPLDSEGAGYRVCDEEGTPTKKNTLIEEGVLKSYLHSFSTSKRGNAKSTGNAGILAPRAWQLKIPPGKASPQTLLAEMDEGLWINNCWYTRYQDYRNGIFSTVPRDGVFYVKNGEVVGTVKGIRISDSVPSILQNVNAIASDSKSVKWWEEISPSSMPSVLVNNVNISKGF